MWLGPGILLCRSLVSLGLIQVVIDVWGLGKVWLNTFEKFLGYIAQKPANTGLLSLNSIP